jgi:hypothetical protein
VRVAPALAALIVLAWAAGASAGVHGSVNVNYFTSQTDTEGQPSSSNQTLLQNYLLDVEGPVTPKLGYAGYLRATRIEQSTEVGGREREQFFTAVEPELQLGLRDPLYNISSGYRRSEVWLGADFDDEERQTSNFYFARLGITPLRLPMVSVQFDRLESFDHKQPMLLDQVDNSLLVDVNYAWQPLRAYYSFNYVSSENEAGGLIGVPGQTTTSFNHLGRLDYNDVFGGKFPLSASYQVNSFDSDVSGAGAPTASQLTGLSAGFALANAPAGPRFTDLTFSASISVSLDQTSRHVGFQLTAPAVCDRIILDLDQTGAVAPVTWQVYARNVGDSSWSFLAEQDVARSGNAFTIDFINTQAFSLYKVVNTTLNLGSRVAGVRAFNRQVAAEPSLSSLSQSLNFNAGAQVAPEVSLTFNFFMDKLDREPDNYLSSFGGLFPSIFESSTGRPGGADSSSSVNRTFGPSLHWLPAAWMAATFNYQRQDVFDSEKRNDVGGNTYSAIFNFSPLATLDTTLSYVRTEQDVRQAIPEQPESQVSTVSDAYLASVTARLLEGLDWVGDFGYTASQRESRTEPTIETDSYFLHGALNAQLTPRLFSTLSYSLNWAYTGEQSSVTRLGTLVVSYRPTARLNTAYSISGSSTDGNRLLAQSLSLDWLVLPAIHFHVTGTHARIWPEGATDQTALAQVVYYLNRYADLQLGYTFNRSHNLVETTTHSFNLFFNGRF